MKANILIVDDEAGVRSSLSGVLRDEGYQVDAVESTVAEARGVDAHVAEHAERAVASAGPEVAMGNLGAGEN
jgi:CheY-like chemotaxis protein